MGAKLAINKGTVLLGSSLVVVVGTLIRFAYDIFTNKTVFLGCFVCKTIVIILS
jgi:hypothetical protein